MKVTKGKSNKHNFQVEHATNDSQKQKSRAGKMYKLSQTESLESNYSRITSVFGFGSRQSSQETNYSGIDDLNQRKVALVMENSNKMRQTSKETGETRDNKDKGDCSDSSQREARPYLLLRRADAIDEVSPYLERWTLPEIVVHRAEEIS